MPNWVKNKVVFYGKDLPKLRKKLKSNESTFDFNNIIPMPNELNVESGSSEHFAIECANLYNKTRAVTSPEYEKSTWQKDKMSFMEWVKVGNNYLNNMKKYGATTWYDWRCNNWGTKWNASEVEWTDDKHVEFETAWSFPEPIFMKIADLYPDLEIFVEFADEDLGHNCGTFEANKTSIHTDYVDNFEFACEVWDLDPEEERSYMKDE